MESNIKISQLKNPCFKILKIAAKVKHLRHKWITVAVIVRAENKINEQCFAGN